MDPGIFDIVYALGRSHSVVPFSGIPEPLKDDFIHFMTGRAIVFRNGEYFAYPSDFREWLQKLSRVGVEQPSSMVPSN